MRTLTGLAIVAMLAGPPAQAQTIPVPFDDQVDTRQISVVVTPGRKTMRGLPGSLRKARAKMHAKQVVSDDHLRRLARAGDGLAAQTYVRLLTGRGEAVSNASDVAFYAAIAVGTGRVWTLTDMIEAMRHLDRASEPRARIRKYVQVLYAHAWAGNTLALDAVVEFNGDDALFGTLSDRTRGKILAEAAEIGDGRTELGMALEILEREQISAAEQAEARDLLTQAHRASHLGVSVTARNLLTLMDQKYDESG